MKKRKTLPTMQCDSGCGECCGLVPATVTEYNRITRLAHRKGLRPHLQGVTCPWFQDGTCSVYEARPFMCKAFGHAVRMPCPRGYNVNLPEREIRRMLRSNGPCRRLLHEHLVDAGLIDELSDVLGAELSALVPSLLENAIQ